LVSPPDFQNKIYHLIQELSKSSDFAKAMPHVERELLDLLQVERITIYRRARNYREIVSKYSSGDGNREIRVALSSSSVAGFVALSHKPLCIHNVQADEELKRIHPKLRFNNSFDKQSGFQTRSMIAVPIKYKEVLLGVLQVLNKENQQPFTSNDVQNVTMLAQLLGRNYRYELSPAQEPFDYLVLQKKITRQQLEILKQRSESEHLHITNLLISEANIQATEIGIALEHYYQVPFMPYDPNIEIPHDLISQLNVTYLTKQLWAPVAGDKSEVTVIIDNPSDSQRIMEIERLLGAQTYVFKVGLPDDIKRFLGHKIDEAKVQVGISELVGRLEEEAESSIDDNNDEEVDENAATVIQLVNRLILDAYKARASDIHIEPSAGNTPAMVRSRIDGFCSPALQIPASHIRAVVSRIKVMSRLDIAERRKPQDGKLVVKYRKNPIELRVATIPTVHGESVVMRILASSEAVPIDGLNLSAKNRKLVEQAVASPHGIFLVVGPTGSGKTTTLHAVLRHINKPDRKIWTAEDPVEITQPGLQQVQINPKIGFNFATALRAFLRADPDVIMIGEMRDAETAQAGVEASLTGHLVISTLHTNSAPATIVRLLDLGIDPISFADAFLGVLAQRLVRTLCKSCKKPYQASQQEYQHLQHYYGEACFAELNIDPNKLTLYKADGCEECNDTGYRGRTGIHELLSVTDEIRLLIYRNGTAAQLKELAVQQGMHTLMQDGIAKLIKGDFDLEQLRRVVVE